MRLFTAIALLGACSSIDEDTTAGVPNALLPTEAAPPPPFALNVSQTYIFPGDTISMSASGLPRAGVRVSFAGSRNSAGAPVCPPAFGACFEVGEPGISLGVLATGAGGATAALSRVVPAGLPPGPLHLQAGVATGGRTYLSEVDTVLVLSPSGDEDGDGLDNASEDAIGSSPFDADSDDGGETDGSEFGAGRNPFDAADDVYAGCYTNFESAYLAFGDGADPTLYYGAHGLVFLQDSGYGLVGGDQYGDPGNWSDGVTVTTPAWGAHDLGTDVNTIAFQGVTSGLAFDLIRAEGGTTVTVQVDASLGGVPGYSAWITTTSRASVTVPGSYDRVTFTIVLGDGFAYAIDNLRWASIPGYACP